MNKDLQELIEISRLDKEIDFMEPRIVEIRKGLTESGAKKEKKENEIFDLEEELKNHKNAFEKSELALKNTSAKLESITKKMSEVKTEKELKALNIEEEIAREQITFQNSEIQRIEKLIQSANEKIQELQQEIGSIESKMQEIEVEISSEIEKVRKEQEKISKKKTLLVGKMDQKVVTFYERVRKWAGNTSVVPVYKQACGGCFIRINDRYYAEILKGDAISTCPHCGRILFEEK